MSDLNDINFDEELVLLSALRHECEDTSRMRADIERHIAAGSTQFAEAAAFYEKRLATLDGLFAKLPVWFAGAVMSRD